MVQLPVSSPGSVHLIPLENIPCIYLVLHIVQTGIIAVGNDGMRLLFECCEVIDNLAAEE